MPKPAFPGHGVLKRALAVWLILIVVEFVHGIFRTIFLVPITGDFRARQIGVFIGSALILVVAYLFVGWVKAPNTKSLLHVGILWLVLTVAFELASATSFFGRSWESLGEDYNLAKGGLLQLGLVVLALSPLIAARLRQMRS